MYKLQPLAIKPATTRQEADYKAKAWKQIGLETRIKPNYETKTYEIIIYKKINLNVYKI